MLAFKNIRAILPTRLPSRLFIIRQSSAFCLILKNGDLAEHLIGPAAKALQLRPSACTKGCGLFSSKPSVRVPLRENIQWEKGRSIVCVSRAGWVPRATTEYAIRGRGESLVTRTSFKVASRYFHFLELYILANWQLLPLSSLYLKQWAWYEISQFFVNSDYHTIIVCKKYLTFS